MKRHHLLLQEMGITQWQLVRPECLKGIVSATLGEHICLVVISDTEKLCLPLLQDVLHSLEIEKTQYLSIEFDFVRHLQLNHQVYYWILSDDEAQIELALSYCHNGLAKWLSPSWEKLQCDTLAKRDLWQQIQQMRK